MTATSSPERTIKHETTSADGRWVVTVYTNGTGCALRDGNDDNAIGLWFDGITLTDYDGTSGFLPRAVALLLIKLGIQQVGNFTEHSL